MKNVIGESNSKRVLVVGKIYEGKIHILYPAPTSVFPKNLFKKYNPLEKIRKTYEKTRMRQRRTP